MEQFSEFMEHYFFYIWLIVAVTITSIFFIRGRKAIEMFSDLDLLKVIYSEKNASGYSTKTFISRSGGASKVLQIIITDKELIVKTFLFLAYVAEKQDLLHRIPFENILKTEIKKGVLFSKLFIEFKDQNGKIKEIVLISRNNIQIKEILDK